MVALPLTPYPLPVKNGARGALALRPVPFSPHMGRRCRQADKGRDGKRPGGSAHFAGLYQASRPFWSFLAATSGVSVPLMTLADSTQVSFSRFGVPRDRIW